MLGIFLLLGGIFTVIASLSDWDWYWKMGRAQMWVSLFGEEGAKAALAILGAILAVVGLFMIFTGQS